MSETKFTPGPWEWDTKPWDYDCQQEAPWLVQKPWREKGSQPIITGDVKCDEANAHLIAASPDMYEALGKARKALQEAVPYMQTDESGKGPDCTDLFQAILDADYALAKARGES